MTDSARGRTLWLEALHADGEAVARTCLDAGLDTPVPSCPGWDLAELVWHLTWVHDLFRTWTERLARSPERIPRPERAPREGLVDAYRQGLHRLESVLATADPDAPVWTFTDDHSVRFVIRRMAHETAVHRWDADAATGRPVPIDARLASDGIDEFLTHFAQVPADGAVPIDGSVHLHCSDVEGEWTLRPRVEGPGFDLERAHAKGDCALRGPANDLLLALWHRRTIDDLDVVGDREVAERFLAFPRLR